MKKYVKIPLIVILAVLTLFLAVALSFFNELTDVFSIRLLRDKVPSHKDGAVYEMTFRGDYYFEDMLKEGGVSSEDDLLAFMTRKLTKNLYKMKNTSPNAGCSSFTGLTKANQQLFGRNYDMGPSNICIVHTKKTKNRHASISTVDLQYIGIKPDKTIKSFGDKLSCLGAVYAPLDGMNDAGVCCGIYISYQGCGEKMVPTNQNTELPDITSTTLLRMILDYADSVDEAVEFARSYDMHDSMNTSFHYMVADSTGKSAILEYVYGHAGSDSNGSLRELKVIYPDESKSYQYVTNFIVSPGYYPPDSEEKKAGEYRYKVMEKTLGINNGVFHNEKKAMDLLQQVGQRYLAKGKGRHDEGWITLYSIVYNMTDKTVLWISNENYDEPNAKFKFEL